MPKYVSRNWKLIFNISLLRRVKIAMNDKKKKVLCLFIYKIHVHISACFFFYLKNNLSKSKKFKASNHLSKLATILGQRPFSRLWRWVQRPVERYNNRWIVGSTENRSCSNSFKMSQRWDSVQETQYGLTTLAPPILSMIYWNVGEKCGRCQLQFTVTLSVIQPLNLPGLIWDVDNGCC
jgi:hypothetical protein